MRREGTRRGGLIGRAAELGIFRETIDAVSTSSEGRAVLLIGEAGIGKSTVLDAALAEAATLDDAPTVLRGRAFPLDANVPFASVGAALGNYLYKLPAARRAELVAGLGSLGVILDDIEPDRRGGSRGDAVGGAALQRTRLFDAVARLLGRLCDEGMVVLALDDMHWADQSSVELVQHLVRDLPSLRLLLVLTARPVELDDRPPVRSLLRSLRHDALLTEVALERFGPTDLHALLTAVTRAHAGIDDSVMALIATRSSGVPFYADVLVRDALAKGIIAVVDGTCVLTGVPGPAPAVVRDEILTSLTQLPPSLRRICDVLSVAGEPTPLDVLVATAGDLDVVGALDELMRRDLVVERAGACYELAHPLYTEVIHETLRDLVRRQIHLGLAVALDAHEPSGPAGATTRARHWRGAGPLADPERLGSVLLDAARAASRVSALDESVQLLTEALPVVRSTGRVTSTVEVLELLGQSWYALGEVAPAFEVLDEAVRLRRELDDDDATARLLFKLAEVAWAFGRFADAPAHAAEALGLLERTADDEAIAMALLRTLVVRLRGGDDTGVPELIDRLTASAARAGSPRAEAIATIAEVLSALVANRWDRLAELDARLHQHVSRTEEPELRFRLVTLRLECALAMGDLAGAEWLAAQLTRCSVEFGRGAFDHRSHSATFFRLIAQARLAEAADHVVEWTDAAERYGVPRGVIFSILARAWLHALQGDAAGARAGVDEARRSFRRYAPNDRSSEAVIAGFAACIGRDLDDRELLAMAIACPHAPFAAGAPLLNVVGRAHGCIAAGAFDEANALADDLARHAPPGTRPLAEASRIRGFASAGEGRAGDARAAFETAARIFDDLGLELDAARCRLEIDDPAHLESALEVFDRGGARLLAERARASLLRCAGSTSQVPDGVARTRRESHEVDLTPREREVAELVAAGLTNGQIAERLFISIRTVTSHLDHAYTRLGIGSRAALAAYVVGGERTASS